MTFLVDRCAGRRIADWLAQEGHDVLFSRDLGPDPGDAKLLEIAGEQGRVLVTNDTDYGKLIYLQRQAHSGLVRLPDVPGIERIEIMRVLLRDYPDALLRGAVITVRGKRIRVSGGQKS